jgi:hypothetical protein
MCALSEVRRVTSQKTAPFIVTAGTISNPTGVIQFYYIQKKTTGEGITTFLTYCKEGFRLHCASMFVYVMQVASLKNETD